MTEAVYIAIISNVTTIIVVILSRVMSHREHRQTAAQVADTNEKVKAIINGQSS